MKMKINEKMNTKMKINTKSNESFFTWVEFNRTTNCMIYVNFVHSFKNYHTSESNIIFNGKIRI